VAGLQPDVPEQADQLLEAPGQRLIGLLRQQDEEIDVGGRVQLATAIAADRYEAKRSRQGESLPGIAQHFVDQPTAVAQQGCGVGVAEEALVEQPLLSLQPCFEIADQLLPGRRLPGHCGVSTGESRQARQVDDRSPGDSQWRQNHDPRSMPPCNTSHGHAMSVCGRQRSSASNSCRVARAAPQ